MHRTFCMAVLLLGSAGFAQTANHSISSSHRAVWEPPAWSFLPELPKASVAKEMLSTLRVSDYHVTLEETKMQDVGQRFGATTGRKGDAGEALGWLCFHGTNAMGRWALWLESGEIDGGTIGSFQWQRLPKSTNLDGRCHLLKGAAGTIELPLTLKLGAGEEEVLQVLGSPTTRHNGRLIYVHEHEESLRGQPYTSSNIVAIRLRNGKVWAIEVSKTTSS